jgi:phosphopantothenate-cysteine ligase
MASCPAERNWDSFFQEENAPSDLIQRKTLVREFSERNLGEGRCVVLVTSGGTSVPLEANTVRYIDNFSRGLRGAASTEYFLSRGYSVIFLHRKGSMEPYLRDFSVEDILSWLSVKDDQLTLEPPSHLSADFAAKLTAYKNVNLKRQLLKIPYISISDYLHYLRDFAEVLSAFKSKVLFYLAAAVSDFYVPQKEMPKHKIQSSSTLSLHLSNVPKLLKPLIEEWAPEAFFVTFKLETDPEILHKKALHSLSTYHQHLVIGNLLANRHEEVRLINKDKERCLRLSENPQVDEIEELIVLALLEDYKSFLQTLPILVCPTVK